MFSHITMSQRTSFATHLATKEGEKDYAELEP